jgi:hypothetical protein
MHVNCRREDRELRLSVEHQAHAGCGAAANRDLPRVAALGAGLIDVNYSCRLATIILAGQSQGLCS